MEHSEGWVRGLEAGYWCSLIWRWVGSCRRLPYVVPFFLLLRWSETKSSLTAGPGLVNLGRAVVAGGNITPFATYLIALVAGGLLV